MCFNTHLRFLLVVRRNYYLGDFNTKIGQLTAEDRAVKGPWGYATEMRGERVIGLLDGKPIVHNKYPLYKKHEAEGPESNTIRIAL